MANQEHEIKVDEVFFKIENPLVTMKVFKVEKDCIWFSEPHYPSSKFLPAHEFLKRFKLKNSCQCLHEIENKLSRTKFCMIACREQKQK